MEQQSPQTAPTQPQSAANAPQAPAAAPSAPQQHVKKGNGFLSFLGKVFLVLIVVGALLGGGYYFGMTGKSKEVAPTPTPEAMVSPTKAPISPTQLPSNIRMVTAGLLNSTAFKPYVIGVPDGWTDVRENTQAAGIDKLTLSKNGYTLTIYQAAFGGGGCTYKGEPEQMMAQAFTDFVDIIGLSDEYRRSWNQTAAKTTSYSICYKGSDKSYGTISLYGAISAVSPNPSDSVMLAEIDSMIASLTKQ